MSTTTSSTRSAELQAAIRFAFNALKQASADYDGVQPTIARKRVAVALFGLIRLISDVFPKESRFALPLNELLYGLMDLDRGKVVPLLSPAKTPNNPGSALADDLFRAIPAAAMTCLMQGNVMKRIPASQDILKRLKRMGTTHLSGKQITAGQIVKWREKMMTELASEDPAVARYELSLEWVSGMKPIDNRDPIDAKISCPPQPWRGGPSRERQAKGRCESRCLVAANIVEDDDVALGRGRSENLLGIKDEELAVGAVDDPKRSDPIVAQSIPALVTERRPV
jgi:hypothetical protein